MRSVINGSFAFSARVQPLSNPVRSIVCSKFIGNSYLAAGGVAFRSVPHMGHFCAVPPGRMLFAIFEFVNGSFVVSFNSSYGSLLCGSWPHARIQKTVADECSLMIF